jgi:hypothetical protein
MTAETEADRAHRLALIEAGYGVMAPEHLARLTQLLAAAEEAVTATSGVRDAAAAYARVAGCVEGTLQGLDFRPFFPRGDES